MTACVCVGAGVCVCVGENMPVSYHDGSDYNCAVFHARRVVWKQRRVLDQNQFILVIPVADLAGNKTRMRLCMCSRVHVHLVYNSLCYLRRLLLSLTQT